MDSKKQKRIVVGLYSATILSVGTVENEKFDAKKCAQELFDWIYMYVAPSAQTELLKLMVKDERTHKGRMSV